MINRRSTDTDTCTDPVRHLSHGQAIIATVLGVGIPLALAYFFALTLPYVHP